MRRITISVLSVFVVFPAVAGSRLPVVNIASGGVSARAAFGDVAPAAVKSDVSTARVATRPTRTRVPVARSATPVATPIDNGAELIAANDVLAPRRPSNDLWAKNDTALRMPRPDEFAVIRNDNPLPEEDLDSATRVAKLAPAPVHASAPTIAQPVIATNNAPMNEFDNQLARISEMERRANDGVRTVSPRTITPMFAATAAVATETPTVVASVDQPSMDNNVSLRRMVVPMDDDVIVRSVEKNTSPRIVAVREDMTKMSPAELRRAFRKTFLSENKHLSAFSIDDRFDVASDMSSAVEGFTANHDLSEAGGIRPLEIKIKFRNEDSALSRANYTLLTEYAGIVVNKPTRAIQVAIPQFMTTDKDARKLAARRLAIVEQVLTDNGVSRQRIVPVLSNRNEQGFVLRIISGDQYDTLTEQKRDIFGDAIGSKTYKSMSW